ncbi:TetR family transcriptional regulator [Pseudonocardia sulfidoxydans NBRC 16205]|uniref:TetR family transcriptional regulator n=1 Tax=Pseudonocardia sulfidoxydans NBRC 16205 TaxID=1223511 RepID=A0A511DPP9_9PSEU|nr:TetR family transcriptional regulator [Pseudonocardia sulfidoxydans NBRC 16205]
MVTRLDDAAVLDAARACVLDVGVRRTTLSDVARRAGVSRMSLYRRWDGVDALVGDLLTRDLLAAATGPLGTDRATIVTHAVEVCETLRRHRLVRKIVDVDPELLLPYLLRRRGRSSDALLALLTDALTAAQDGGTVRDGDTAVLARFVLLTAQSYVLSAGAVTAGTPAAQLPTELHALLDGYLRP